jgi:hypothetical protein
VDVGVCPGTTCDHGKGRPSEVDTQEWRYDNWSACSRESRGHDLAVVEPEARAALVRFDNTVQHYEVLAAPDVAD